MGHLMQGEPQRIDGRHESRAARIGVEKGSRRENMGSVTNGLGKGVRVYRARMAFVNSDKDLRDFSRLGLRLARGVLAD